MAAFSLLCVVRVIYGTTRGAGGICTSQGEKGGCPKPLCPPQAGWVGQGRQQHSARCSAGAEVPEKRPSGPPKMTHVTGGAALGC